MESEFVPPLLEVAGLTKRYGDHTALSHLDLRVCAGEVVGLLGPNGAGKTTAIECIAGLLTPDAGQVRFSGETIVLGMPPGASLLGIALQDTQLQDHVTPTEALRIFAHLSKMRVEPHALLERFGLGVCANARYDRLSGGQKQSLALALAFIGDPQIVVLDEPTRGLDLGARAQLHRSITGMRDEGRGVLMATHDLAEAEKLCDTVAIISAGRLLASGRTSDLIGARGTLSSVALECDRPLDLRHAQHLVGNLAPRTSFSLQTSNSSLAMGEVAGLVKAQGCTIVSFAIGRANLEDLVLSLDPDL